MSGEARNHEAVKALAAHLVRRYGAVQSEETEEQAADLVSVVLAAVRSSGSAAQNHEEAPWPIDRCGECGRKGGHGLLLLVGDLSRHPPLCERCRELWYPRSPQGEDHGRVVDPEITAEERRARESKMLAPQGEDHEDWRARSNLIGEERDTYHRQRDEEARLRFKVEDQLKAAQARITELESQGEDHEAANRNVPGDAMVAFTFALDDAGQSLPGSVMVDVLLAVAPFLSRCPSPERNTEKLVEALREIKRVAAIEAPPVSDEVPAKVWKLAFDALAEFGSVVADEK